MGVSTGIEWTDHTFNPWRGCQKVSPGCANCYAEKLSHRNPAVLGEWGPEGNRVVAAESYWKQPLKWDRDAKEAGQRRRVFCASLADVFENYREQMKMPNGSWATINRHWGKFTGYHGVNLKGGNDAASMAHVRERLFRLIEETPNLDWLLLTKRPENIAKLWPSADIFDGSPGDGKAVYLPNVWLGVSVEDQQRADERIPILLQTPAAVRFLSVEPLLGPVDLDFDQYESPGWFEYRKNLLHWIIVGGESGPDARPCHPDWVRSIRDQCQAAGVPFFFKQIGEWGWGSWRGHETHCMYADGRHAPFTKESLVEEEARSGKRHDNRTATVIAKIGKKAAGKQLDGREWQQFPKGATP